MALVVQYIVFLYVVLCQSCTTHALPRVYHMGRASVGHGPIISGVVKQTASSDTTQCLPDEYQNVSVPKEIVSCNGGVCSCDDCFTAAGSICAIGQCWSFENGSCIDGRNRSKLISILLTAFLSSIGAANFYIGRYDLGVIQLAIFIFAIPAIVYGVILCCCCRCDLQACLHSTPHCCGCDDWSTLPDGDDPDEGPRTITIVTLCCICCGVMIVFLAVLVTITWWLADLVIFATNQRLDGNGCPLK